VLQVIQTLFFLVVIAGLAYVSARFLGSRAMRLSQGGLIRLIEMVSLGPRKYACVLTVGDKAFLLGVTDQCVSMIAEIPRGELGPLSPSDGESAAGAGARDFVARLSALLGRPGEGRR